MMKKLKIRGNEVKRLGYDDDRAISLALKIARENFRRDQKEELMIELQKVQLDPSKYTGDKVFGDLARLIKNPEKTKKDHPVIRKQPFEFKIFGRELIDGETVQQMETAMKMPVVTQGALMADAHLGYGLPIGGVVGLYNAVMPYGVGMDIGCRMHLSVFSEDQDFIRRKRERIKNAVIEHTRFGLAEFNDLGEQEIMERKEFREIPFIKSLKDGFYRQLGTSGHGNHFVDIGFMEIDEEDLLPGIGKGKYFAILSHSGSRNFGAEVAKHYTAIAKSKHGFTGEAANLSWLDLDTEEGEEYWMAMNLAGDYAATNHRIIHEKLCKALGMEPAFTIENHHNFAWKEELPDGKKLIIHRKGATPAGPGDLGIIPGNMISPAFIVRGKGFSPSLNSASHGAGRSVSRRQAKKRFSRNRLEDMLKHAGVELIGGGTDESPDAYKNIERVMEAQKDLVDILGRFYPKIVRME